MSANAFERMPGSNDRAQLALFRKALWEEHYGLCGICGQSVGFVEMQVDHVVLISLGGGHGWLNLQPSHRTCNIAKGGRNRGPAPLPNAARLLTGERPIVDDETIQAWIGDWQPSALPTMVRNLAPDVWERIKTEARRHDLSAGALLNLIAAEWLAEHACMSYGGPLSGTPGAENEG